MSEYVLPKTALEDLQEPVAVSVDYLELKALQEKVAELEQRLSAIESPVSDPHQTHYEPQSVMYNGYGPSNTEGNSALKRG